MKTLLAFCLASTLACTSAVTACNLSDFSLVSLVMSGSNYELTLSVCLGAGRTATIPGGDMATMDLAIGMYRAAGPINIISYSPTFVTSPGTGCTMDIYDIGPEPTTFFTQATLYYYFDPLTYPACANGFECIHSTALCGFAAQRCYALTVTLDALPDSLRLFGAEGAGNPFAGCMPNPDMLIDLSALGLEVQSQDAYVLPGKGVQVEWAGTLPVSDGRIVVERKPEADTLWQQVAELHAPPGGEPEFSFKVLDAKPQLGSNLYRVCHVSPSGIMQAGGPMRVEVTDWQPMLLPNPAGSQATLVTGQPEPMMGTVEIMSMEGRLILRQEALLMPSHPLDLSKMAPGVYHLGLDLPGHGRQWMRLVRE